MKLIVTLSNHAGYINHCFLQLVEIMTSQIFIDAL